MIVSVNEWIGVVSFALGILGGLWKLSDNLNGTLKELSHQIKLLHDSITRSEREQLKMNSIIEKHDDRLDIVESDVKILKDWRERT